MYLKYYFKYMYFKILSITGAACNSVNRTCSTSTLFYFILHVRTTLGIQKREIMHVRRNLANLFQIHQQLTFAIVVGDSSHQ